MKIPSLPCRAPPATPGPPCGPAGRRPSNPASRLDGRAGGYPALPAGARQSPAVAKNTPAAATNAQGDTDTRLRRRARNADVPAATDGTPAPVPFPSTIVRRLSEEPGPFSLLQAPLPDRLNYFFPEQGLTATQIVVIASNEADTGQFVQFRRVTLAEMYGEGLLTGKLPPILGARLQPGRYASPLETLDLASILDEGSKRLTPGAVAERIRSYWNDPPRHLGAPSRRQWLGRAMSQVLLDETRARIQTGELPPSAMAVAAWASDPARQGEHSHRIFSPDPQHTGLAPGTVIITGQGVDEPGVWWGPDDPRCPAPGRHGGGTTVSNCELPWNLGQPQEGGLTLLWEPGKPLRSFGSLNALQNELRRASGNAQARLVLTPHGRAEGNGSAGDARVAQLQVQQIRETQAAVDRARAEGSSLQQTEARLNEIHTRSVRSCNVVHVVGMIDARLRREADESRRSGRLSLQGAAIVEHALSRAPQEEDQRVCVVNAPGGLLHRGSVVMTERPMTEKDGRPEAGRVVVWEPGQPLREYDSYDELALTLRLRAGARATVPTLSLRPGTPGQIRMEQDWQNRATPSPRPPDLLSLTLRPAGPADTREAQLLAAALRPERPDAGPLIAELRTALNREHAVRRGIAEDDDGQGLRELNRWGEYEHIKDFATPGLRLALKEQTGQDLDPDHIRIHFVPVPVPKLHAHRVIDTVLAIPLPRLPPPVSRTLAELALENIGGLDENEDYQVNVHVTDERRQPIRGLDWAGVQALVQKVDIGKTYPEHLKDRLLTSAGGHQLQRAHRDLTLASMRSDALVAYLEGHLSPDRRQRNLRWLRAVVDHPVEAARPRVDGQTITANTLSVRGLPLPGMLIIRPDTESRDPSVVVYAAGAPDGVAFKAYESLQAAVEDLRARPGMTDWMALQLPTSAQQEAGRFLRSGRTPTLTRVQDDFANDLYERKVANAYNEAGRTTISNYDLRESQHAARIQAGLGVAKTLFGFVPVAGTLIHVGEALQHVVQGITHQQNGDDGAAADSFLQASLAGAHAIASFVGDGGVGGGLAKGTRGALTPRLPSLRAATPKATVSLPVPPARAKGPLLVRRPDGSAGILMSPTRPPQLGDGASAGGAPGTATLSLLDGLRPPTASPGPVPSSSATSIRANNGPAHAGGVKRKSGTPAAGPAAKIPGDVDSPTYRMPTIAPASLPPRNAPDFNERISKESFALVRRRFNLFGPGNTHDGNDVRNAAAQVQVIHVQGRIYNNVRQYDYTLAMQKGAGNCGEMSGSAAQIVKMSSPGTAVAQYRIGNQGAHAFALTGAPATRFVAGQGNAVDLLNAPADAWVMDPWAEIVCPAREYPRLFKEKMHVWDLEGKLVMHKGVLLRPSEWHRTFIEGQQVFVNIPYDNISMTSTLDAAKGPALLDDTSQQAVDDFDLNILR